MSREILRQAIVKGNREQIEASRKRMQEHHSGNLLKFNEDCREVWGMTRTKGWAYLAGWLADRANPYAAMKNGEFDTDKLKDAKLAMEILTMVNAMSDIAQANDAREGKNV